MANFFFKIFCLILGDFFMDAIKDFFLGPTVGKSDYLYKAPHLISLALVIVATLVITTLFSKKSEKTKRTVIVVFASILLGFEILSRVAHFIKGGEFFSSTVIPMHFYSIMVWIIIVAAFSNNKHLYSISAM